MISPVKAMIEKFYAAFQNKDAETMISCYADDITFEDPVFGMLKDDDAKAMWRMLCRNARNLRVEVSDINASLKKGSAHWEAWYTFGKTGRNVHNVVEATFEFKDGKIVKHTDSFNLYKWASQALGFKGWLFARTASFKNKMQMQTHKLLAEFKEANKL